MKTLYSLLIIVSLVMLPPSAAAQNPIKAIVDYPANDAIVSQGSELGVRIFGWAVNCYTGQQPPVLQVYRQTGGPVGGILMPDVWTPVAVTVTWRRQRPDVLAAITWVCNAMDAQMLPDPVIFPSADYLGFVIAFPFLEPLPIGMNELLVIMADPVTGSSGAGTRAHRFKFEITP